MEDIKIKIVANLHEKSSTKEIQDQLDKISKNLKINVGVDPKQFTEINKAIKSMQDQLSKSGKGLKVVDEKDITNGKQLFTSIDAAIQKYQELGKVKINNKIFDPETKELKSFNIELHNTLGTIEKLKFESTKLKGMHGVSGFVLTGQKENDARAFEMEKALQKTIQNRANEEKKAAEAQAKAINQNIDNQHKQQKAQEEFNKQLQKEIELYQRSKQIQASDLSRRYGDKLNTSALNNQMSQVMAIDPKVITSMQQFRNIQRDIDLGFREIQSSVKSSSSHVISFGEAFRTAMVKFRRLVQKCISYYGAISVNPEMEIPR